MHVLGVLLRVTAGAAVTETRVEVAALVELQLPAVVIRVRLLDGEENPPARPDAVAAGGTVDGDARVALEVGVRDVEEMVRRVVRVESHRQEALLTAAHDDVVNVEERPRDVSAADDLDRPPLLDDVERVGIDGGGRDKDRRVESGGDLAEGEAPS